MKKKASYIELIKKLEHAATEMEYFYKGTPPVTTVYNVFENQAKADTVRRNCLMQLRNAMEGHVTREDNRHLMSFDIDTIETFIKLNLGDV